MNYDIVEYEGQGGEITQVQEVSASVLESMTRAEVDVQITTAKKFPRSLQGFLNDAESCVCRNPDVAASCIYALPRGGKTIEGPSVRMAEILAHCWGNLLVMSRISQETDRFIVAQCLAWDLEKNSRAGIEVRRKITDRNGRRLNDDMITMTCNAALSIAYRNAVWKIIPAAFYGTVYQKARRLAGGQGKSIEERRKGVQEWIAGIGVKAAELFAFLGVKGWEDISLDHMATLAGIITSLKDGETTVDQVFRPKPDAALSSPDPQSKADRLTATLASQVKAPETVVVESPAVAPGPPKAETVESSRPATKASKQGLFPGTPSGPGAYVQS